MNRAANDRAANDRATADRAATGLSRWGPWAALAVAAALPFALTDRFLVVFLANTLIFAMLALGLQITFGAAGMIVLSQAAFFGVGAYTAALLARNLHVPFLLTLPAAAVAAGLTGLVMAPVVRLKEVYFAMATFSFGAITAVLLRELPFTGGVNGLMGIPPASLAGFTFSDEGRYYYLILALVTLQYWLYQRLLRAPFGLALNAIRQNELAARAVGMPVATLQVKAILLGVTAAGAAGALFAHTQGFISPDIFSVSKSLFILGMVVVGGLNSLPGAFVGALIIQVVSEYLRDFKEATMLVYGVILVTFMVGLSKGLWGFLTQVGPWRTGRYLEDPGEGEPPPALSPSALSPSAVSPPAQSGAQGEELLRADHLTRRFSGIVAVDDVNFVVRRGEIHGLVGPNGAGKTSMLNLISGLYRPSSGSIRFKGGLISGRHAHDRAHLGIGRTFQAPQVMAELSALENVALGAFRWLPTGLVASLLGPRYWRRATLALVRRARGALDFVGLGHLADTPAGGLSYGQQKLLEIARSLAGGPELLLLDEPGAGLTQAEVMQVGVLIRRVRDLGVTVVVIEHNMQMIMSLCDLITVLDFGKVIAEGSPAQVRTDERVLEAYLGRGGASYA